MMSQQPDKAQCDLPSCALILDTMAGGLFTVDCDCRIRVWNRAMEKLTGYRAEEAVGQPCSFLECSQFLAQRTAGGRIECALLSGESKGVEQHECTVTARDGTRVPVLKNARAIRTDDGTITGVVETVTDISALKRLEQEVSVLRRSAPAGRGMGRLIGASKCMQDVYERIRLAAGSNATVLVHGDTGSGKELIAEAIHTEGDRAAGPFVKVNCSALTENLLESELFGHVRGAFTGAVRDKVGRFEAADGGTIFLDEIGDISPLIQLKLLRVLQEREFERVGESTSRKVDVRVVAATHRDLRALVRQGEFREDLYYRVRVFDIGVPPLRERREDIPLLVETFIQRFKVETGKNISRISPEVNYCLMDYCWPGNVRELEHAIEHAFVTCQGDCINLFDLPVEIRMTELRAATCRSAGTEPGRSAPPDDVRPYRADTREGLLGALEAARWNKARAARLLGITRTTVWRKMKQWDIPLDAD
jgi:two-component system, NtrC family, response regulator HydG